MIPEFVKCCKCSELKSSKECYNDGCWYDIPPEEWPSDSWICYKCIEQGVKEAYSDPAILDALVDMSKKHPSWLNLIKFDDNKIK